MNNPLQDAMIEELTEAVRQPASNGGGYYDWGATLSPRGRRAGLPGADSYV